VTQLPHSDRKPSVIGALLLALVCVLALQPIFAGALFFVRSHTDLEAVKKNVAQAYEDGVLSVDEVPRQFIHRYGHQFTECLGIQVALDDEKDLWKAVLAPQLHSLYISPCRELQLAATNVQTAERTDYSRYWHGYRLYLWPMLEHLSLATMRFINAAILVGVLVFFYRSLRIALGTNPAIVLFLVLMSLTDLWRIWRMSTQFVPMILILAGAGLFARMYARNRNPSAAVILAAVLGAVFNYLDFLFNPPMLPMLLAFLVLAVEAPQRSYATRSGIADALRLPALVAFAWFSGYALSWAAKWGLSMLLSDDAGGTMLAIYRQIQLRLYGQEVDSHLLVIPLLSTAKMFVQSLLAVGLIPFCFLVVAIVRRIRADRQGFDRRRFLVLSSPVVIPIVWFELLSNHTQTHSHFTYRSAAAAIAMILAAAILAMAEPPSLRTLFAGMRRGRTGPG